MTAVVVGGSSGLGRALCEQLAAQGRTIVLVASGAADCTRLAVHLRLLHGVTVVPCPADARDPTGFCEAVLRGLDGLPPVADLFLPMGLASDDDQVGAAGRRMDDLWHVNYAAVVRTIEAIEPRMASDGGRIVGFGSIAAARARNRNVQYAAAKAALGAYFRSLRHALVGTPVVAQFYVVGYIDSGQSFGRTQLFPPLSPERAARRVLADGRRDVGERYLPGYWAVVTAILRLLPWRVFSRLNV